MDDRNRGQQQGGGMEEEGNREQQQGGNQGDMGQGDPKKPAHGQGGQHQGQNPGQGGEKQGQQDREKKSA